MTNSENRGFLAFRSYPIVGQAMRFMVSTGFSATLSFLFPIMLHEWFGIDTDVAVAIGFATAYVGNIFLLRVFVFRSRGPWRRQTMRYVATNGVFRLAEYGAFYALSNLVQLDYRLAILFVLAVSSGLKFIAYRWIFTDEPATVGS